MDYDSTLKKISPELLLLIICAKGNDGEKEKVHTLLSQCINWDLFLQMAVHHRVYPLVYKTLSSLNNLSVPPYVLETLQKEYRKNALKAVNMTGEMVRIVRCFEDNGIDTLVMKGPPLALKLYGDIALRPFHDIDIMVDPEDLERAQWILKKEGYEIESLDFQMTPRRKKAYLKKLKHIKYFNHERNICLELHWKLHSIDLNYPGLSNVNRRKAAVGGITIPVMNDEELLLFLMVHGSSHRWFRLRWLCDIERFLKPDNRIDWDKIFFLADNSQLNTIVNQTIILVNKLLGALIPDRIIQCAARDKRAWKLACTVVDELFDRKENMPDPNSPLNGNFRVMIRYNLNLRSVWKDKMSYLASLLEPTIKDFKLISLPDSLYPLYYIIRPFNWLYRHKNIFSRKKTS